MSPHIIQYVAQAQMDDHLRSAERRRRAAELRTRPAAPDPRPGVRRSGLRSLRVIFG